MGDIHFLCNFINVGGGKKSTGRGKDYGCGTHLCNTLLHYLDIWNYMPDFLLSKNPKKNKLFSDCRYFLQMQRNKSPPPPPQKKKKYEPCFEAADISANAKKERRRKKN